MKQKILYIITKSNFGGAQRYVYDLATSLPSHSYSVTVALGNTGDKNSKTGALKDKLEMEGVHVIPITNFVRDMSLARDIKVFFEILSLIKKVRPDVLHVTSSKAGGVGALCGRLMGVKKVIFTSHGLAFDERWRPKWQRMLIWVASWLTMLLAKETIQITKDTFTRAKDMPFLKNKMVLIHNGIHPPVFLGKEESRKKLGISTHNEDSVWIGTLAELTPNKNLGVLIEALYLLTLKNVHAHLWILGEGEERTKLENLAKELNVDPFVHMPGYVQNAAELLQAFDMFALPSKKECLPPTLSLLMRRP